MNRIIPLMALVLMTGCVTPTGERNIAPLVRTGTYFGTAYALADHPERRQEFEQVAFDLRVLENGDTIDLATVLLIVQRMTNDNPRSKSSILITGAIVMLSDYGASLPPDQMDKLRPVVKAMREGIELGLGTPPTTLGKSTI